MNKIAQLNIDSDMVLCSMFFVFIVFDGCAVYNICRRHSFIHSFRMRAHLIWRNTHTRAPRFSMKFLLFSRLFRECVYVRLMRSWFGRAAKSIESISDWFVFTVEWFCNSFVTCAACIILPFKRVLSIRTNGYCDFSLTRCLFVRLYAWVPVRISFFKKNSHGNKLFETALSGMKSN